MFYVYFIQNKINNKIYIGKTNNLVQRFGAHKRIAKTGRTEGRKVFSLIHQAIAKYGVENFIFSSLEEFSNEEECLNAEKFWIDFFKSDVNKFGNDYGYNLTAGGDGIAGRSHSNESKLKISKKLKGRKLSDEQKLKISNSHKNKENKNRLDTGCKIVWPKDSELIEMINQSTYKEVAKKLGVSDRSISARIKRRNLSSLIIEKRGLNLIELRKSIKQ